MARIDWCGAKSGHCKREESLDSILGSTASDNGSTLLETERSERL